MLIFVPFIIAMIIMVLIVEYRISQKETEKERPLELNHVSAKEAFHAYNDAYKGYIRPTRYNRVAFQLVDDTPVFLEDNPCTSAYMSPEELATVSPDTEVFTMVVATSNLFGYTSYSNKKAKKAYTLVFRSAPFHEIGRFGKGLCSSWRINEENFHVLDDHFMNVDQIENFKAQVMADYEFDEKY